MLFEYLGWSLLAAATAGLFCATAGTLFLHRKLRYRGPDGHPSSLPAISILKPLHGAPVLLEEALASALRQDYAAPVQLICGVQSGSDPAVPIVARLQKRFPEADVALIVDSRLHGANRKISNLANMMRAAKHDVLIAADADIVAPRKWLSSIVAALGEKNVGAVSCFYAGEGDGLWAYFSAMGITYQFLPNAVFGALGRLAHPFFGATMAFSRQTLTAIGGFEAFRDCLADDYEIGKAVRARGLRLAYPPVVVRHICANATFPDLWNHELRWARTIRTISPSAHWGSLLTHTVSLSLAGAALLRFTPVALAVFCAIVLARLLLKTWIDHITGENAGPVWLLPIRDVIAASVFLVSVLGFNVDWRGDRLRIGKNGIVSQVSG